MAGGNPLTRRTLCIGVGATVAMAGLGALRYVGSENATAMAQRSLCLEEYITYLARQ